MGFLIGAVGGAILGVWLGVSPFASRLLNPYLNALNALPKVALAPLFVLWFGLGIESKIALAAVLVLFLVFLNTFAGVREVDQDLIDGARLMRATRTQVILKVIIPSAMSWVFAGLKIAMPYALIGAVLGEMIAANRGLGYLVQFSGSQFDTAGVFAVLFVIALLAVGAELSGGSRARPHGTLAHRQPLNKNSGGTRNENPGSAVAALCALSASVACAEPVKITNIGHGYFSAALYVAKQEKIFEKYGLEPDISYVQGGALALQATLTKQADVGILSYEHVLTVAAQGKRIVAFYCVANRPVNNVIGNEALLKGAEKLSVEEKVKRLKGMRVAMPSANGSGEKMLGVLAKKYNLTLPGRHQERLSRRRGAGLCGGVPARPGRCRAAVRAGRRAGAAGRQGQDLPQHDERRDPGIPRHPVHDARDASGQSQGQAGAAAQGRAGVHRGDEDPQDRAAAREGAAREGISRT